MEREMARQREPEARVEAHYEQQLKRWERRVLEARATRLSRLEDLGGGPYYPES